MNNFWKSIVLILILLIGLAAYNMFSGNPQYTDDMGTQYQEDYQRQMDVYEQQIKKVAEQQLETERQQEISKTQIVRMNQLLEKWEKQAERYDAILDRWEKQANIKTQ